MYPRLVGLAWEAWRTGRRGQAAVGACQQARLPNLVQFARAHSPFYRELYRNLPEDIVDLRQIPPVTKPQLMANFDDWVTDSAVTLARVRDFLADKSRVGKRYVDRYMVMTTSGVTGERGIFLHDRDAVALYRALTFVRGWLPRMNTNVMWPALKKSNRLAALVTVGGHYGGATIMEAARQDHPWPFNRIKVLSVLRPLPELVRELNSFQPAQLVSYPSALLLMAMEQLAGRLQIHPVIVSSGGDWLGPSMRQQIEAAFRCPVHENYGASEFPPLAWDCCLGKLHLSADWAILEPVDSAYRPVSPGQPSYSVLLTNLVNRVQPIIRYDLGDTVVAEREPCLCGNPLPAIRVEGRRDEILYLETARGKVVPLQPTALGRVLNETPGVRVAQVVQTRPSVLNVRMEALSGADKERVWQAMADRLRDYLSAHDLAHITLVCDPAPPVRESGKLPRVVRDLRGN
ncbi:MAG: phenylacetate--CoA ligase family protein [Deltaproteobacteria bacterium]|nr:phenylacetate--CoA ligase family protein [Deltaproteobacteria bacterium]